MSLFSSGKPRFEQSAEMQLLLACSHSRLSDEQRQHVADMLVSSIDWTALIGMSRIQGVFPLVYKNIRSVNPSAWPESKVRQLKTSYYGYVCNAMLLFKAHLDIIRLLQQHELRAVPYKGPVFAQLIYGDYALRQYSDLDVIVLQKDFVKAHELLLAHRFVLLKKPDEELSHSFKYDLHWSYLHPEKRYVLEVHWDLVKQRRLRHGFHLDAHWQNMRVIELEGFRFRYFDLPHLLLFGCLHAAKHSFECLKWICDISEMIKKLDPQTWDYTFQRAEQYHIRRILQTGLVLANDLLHAPVPREILNSCRSRPVYILEKMAFKTAFNNHKSVSALGHNLRNYIFVMLSRERWRDKVIMEFFLPNERDRKLIDLPPALYFLYFFIRGGRLTKVYFNYLLSLVKGGK